MDFSQLKRYSIFDRKSLVQAQSLSTPPPPPISFQSFLDSLPNALKAKDFKAFLSSMHQAKQGKKPIIWMMGAHPIKVGLTPWLVEAMRHGFMTHLALNGATLVHDFEMALCGNTSEDVAEALADGSFGMTRETGETLNTWIGKAAEEDKGLGKTIGQEISQGDYPYRQQSLYANAWQHDISTSVHIAIGTDVIHHHPEASGEALGKTSLRDFHTLCEHVGDLGDGGAVLNIGSAVILPEVFLKALTVARNINGPISNFTTANFDMLQHYRPNENVVRRPTLEGGNGYTFTGHHEIMLPLFIAALIDASMQK
ncbi:hypothetical protein GF373_07885 [bacterium]|nr:hypothetical protein [bacterium]